MFGRSSQYTPRPGWLTPREASALEVQIARLRATIAEARHSLGAQLGRADGPDESELARVAQLLAAALATGPESKGQP
jgi:hypothetical protein